MAEQALTTTTSRRLFLSAGPGAAIFGALALSAAIPQIDPTFAAIERHKTAWEAFGEACCRTDEVLAEEQGRKVAATDYEANEAASLVERQRFEELCDTLPLTLPGLRAAIEHIAEIERGSIPEAGGYFLFKLLKSPLLAA